MKKKFIMLIIFFLIILGTIILYNKINLKEKNIKFYNDRISPALKNEYDEEIEMDYVSSNNTNLKINQLMLDEFNLGIMCDIVLNENKLSDLIDVEFKNTIIIDDISNILYAKYENEDELIKYCEEKNLDIGKYGNGFSDGSYTGKIVNIQDNNLLFSFYTSSENFPNSQKLYIKFDTIYLTKKNNDIEIIDGVWEINLDLGNIAQKRKEVEYSVININDSKTTITKSLVSMSNMKLELITNSDKIDFKKLKNKDINIMNVNDMIPFHEMYIETENGQKYFQSSYGSNGYDTIEDGKIRYYVTFDYTYYDIAEKVKIILPTNKKEEIIIELQINKDEVQ